MDTGVRNRIYLTNKGTRIGSLFRDELEGKVGVCYEGEYEILWNVDEYSCCRAEETQKKFEEIKDWITENGLSTIFDQKW
jgi:hypothetical protein